MKTMRVFKSGNSQAVRIPKKFLRPKKRSWAPLFESLDKFTDDFMKGGRNQQPVPRLKLEDWA